MKKYLIAFLTCLLIVGCSPDEVEEDNEVDTEQQEVEKDISNQPKENPEGQSETEEDNNERENEQNGEKQTNELGDIVDIQSDEVMEFVEIYNEKAPLNEVELIIADQIMGPFEYDEDYLLALKLTDDFFIYAIIDEDGSVSSYNIEISNSDELENAVYAFVNLTDSLGIDFQEIAPKFEEASTKESVTYFGDDYIVLFNNFLLRNITEGNTESDLYMKILFTKNFLSED